MAGQSGEGVLMPVPVLIEETRVVFVAFPECRAEPVTLGYGECMVKVGYGLDEGCAYDEFGEAPGSPLMGR